MFLLLEKRERERGVKKRAKHINVHPNSLILQWRIFHYRVGVNLSVVTRNSNPKFRRAIFNKIRIPIHLLSTKLEDWRQTGRHPSRMMDEYSAGILETACQLIHWHRRRPETLTVDRES